jgi:hypothetical protein
MTRIWATALEEEDYGYLKRKAIERKRAESHYLAAKSRVGDLLRPGSAAYSDRHLDSVEEMYRLSKEEWDSLK